MARYRNNAKLGVPSQARKATSKSTADPPAPFKRPADVLEPFISTLDKKRVYITHIDTKPVDFKRKIFMIPVVMNLAVVALFVWRVRYIGPWYLQLLSTTFGEYNSETVIAADTEWDDLVPIVAHRAAHFVFDLFLATFLWPWPVNFVLPVRGDAGSPVAWRWNVGFRPKEIVVRRSRGAWAEKTSLRDVVLDDNSRTLFMSRVGMATDPLMLNEKTGYVLMNADWDLDWAGMVDATTMVDEKLAAIEAFSNVVLVHHDEYGWISVDLKQQVTGPEDERRRQVLMFRQALADMGKEDLFYRWIEMIQFEANQPGGFSEEKQVEAAVKVREMFEKHNVDFDKLWKDATGVDPSEGLSKS